MTDVDVLKTLIIAVTRALAKAWWLLWELSMFWTLYARVASRTVTISFGNCERFCDSSWQFSRAWQVSDRWFEDKEGLLVLRNVNGG